MDKLIGAVGGDFTAGYRPVRSLLESYRPRDLSEYQRTVDLLGRGSLREAMVTGDLPILLAAGTDLHINAAYGSVAQNWRSVFKVGALANFRENKFANLLQISTDDEAGAAAVNNRMPMVPEAHGYSEARMAEFYELATLATYGVTFSITRQMLINDDLNALAELPSALGRSMGRTLNWHVANALALTSSTSVSGHVCRDTYNFFGTSNHINMATGATPLSAANVTAQAALFLAQTDPSGLTNAELGRGASWIIVPKALEMTAMQIVSNTALIGASGTVQTSINLLAGMGVCVIPELDAFSKKDWYLCSNLADGVGLQVSFLRGRETPELFVQDGLGADLASADGLKHKIRHDFDVHPINYACWRKIDDTTS